MTMIIDGTNGLTFNNATTQASAGQVLQVVNASYGTLLSTTSTSPVTTNLTASITPKFSTSKILVMVTVQGVNKYAGNINTGANLYLYRNGSSIKNYALYVGYTNTSTANLIGGNAINYLDSPATTSSTTYAIYLATTVSGQQVEINSDADFSTITLMEIAG